MKIGTPSGTPKSKQDIDPVSALSEHYHQKGDGTRPEYSSSYDTIAQGFVCRLKLPDREGSIQAFGKNKKVARREVARMACRSVLG